VLPADPFQLFLLCGAVLLVAAHGLRWRPVTALNPDVTGWRLQIFPPLAALATLFAGSAGYFISFWPGSHPIRRILLVVFFPILFCLTLWFALIIYSRPLSSVFERTGIAPPHVGSALGILGNLPQGFQASLMALLLIAIYGSRLAFGIAKLPISLSERYSQQSDDCDSWRRLQPLVWFLVGPAFFVSGLFSAVTFSSPLLRYLRSPSDGHTLWVWRLVSVAEVSVVFGIALLLVGREGRRVARHSVRIPSPRWIGLAAFLPVFIEVLIPTGEYILDRAHWAAYNFGRFAPPQFQSYFDVPNVSLFLLFFPAFFEETIFRGVLQTSFTRRYGLHRGIFLVGIVWAAFHVFSDFSFLHFQFTNLDVLARLAWRLFFAIALSFVFGWLTSRSESIFPAAIAHTLYNVLVYSQPESFAGKNTLRVALYAALAYALFRYWPVSGQPGAELDIVNETPEPPALEPTV
jgi:membrane protease YdiL (CAAX protease family)